MLGCYFNTIISKVAFTSQHTPVGGMDVSNDSAHIFLTNGVVLLSGEY
jgi:hypothetical protein